MVDSLAGEAQQDTYDEDVVASFVSRTLNVFFSDVLRLLLVLYVLLKLGSFDVSTLLGFYVQRPKPKGRV